MTVIEFYNELKKLYPDSLSCEWDNDGLMCSPNINAYVNKVLVALDVTDGVLSYAKEQGFDTVLTHHPMIFKSLSSVTETSLTGARALFAIKNGISVISLHTRLDAGKCGVNDRLAELLGLYDVSTFGDEESPELGRIGYTDLPAEEFISNLKTALNIKTVNAYLTRSVNKVAVVGGSGKDFISAAISMGADTLVTGECSYNNALDAAEMGLNVIEAGHYATEFPVCSRLADLAVSLASAEVEIYELTIPRQI